MQLNRLTCIKLQISCHYYCKLSAAYRVIRTEFTIRATLKNVVLRHSVDIIIRPATLRYIGVGFRLYAVLANQTGNDCS
ncbi:hypothetical protein D3C81_2183380 [compost metagenome]